MLPRSKHSPKSKPCVREEDRKGDSSSGDAAKMKWQGHHGRQCLAACRLMLWSKSPK